MMQEEDDQKGKGSVCGSCNLPGPVPEVTTTERKGQTELMKMDGAIYGEEADWAMSAEEVAKAKVAWIVARATMPSTLMTSSPESCPLATRLAEYSMVPIRHLPSGHY